MSQTNYIDRAIERILAINWQPDDFRRPSNIRLLREYLRRAALWAEAMNGTDEWPFFDIAARVAPSFQFDESKIEIIKQHWERSQLLLNTYEERTCIEFIRWAMVKNQPEIVRFNLTDPYDPLILIYERGGSVFRDKGLLEVSGFALPIGNWKIYYQTPEIQLDSEELDKLDSE